MEDMSVKYVTNKPKIIGATNLLAGHYTFARRGLYSKSGRCGGIGRGERGGMR